MKNRTFWSFFAQLKENKRVILNALVKKCRTKTIAQALVELQNEFPIQYADALKGKHSRASEILADISTPAAATSTSSSLF